MTYKGFFISSTLTIPFLIRYCGIYPSLVQMMILGIANINLCLLSEYLPLHLLLSTVGANYFPPCMALDMIRTVMAKSKKPNLITHQNLEWKIYIVRWKQQGHSALKYRAKIRYICALRGAPMQSSGFSGNFPLFCTVTPLETQTRLGITWLPSQGGLRMDNSSSS